MCDDKITEFSDMVIVDWHNCDNEIGQHLHYASNPLPGWNNGQPGWALVLTDNHGITYFKINYCPVCGERLWEREETDTR